MAGAPRLSIRKWIQLASLCALVAVSGYLLSFYRRDASRDNVRTLLTRWRAKEELVQSPTVSGRLAAKLDTTPPHGGTKDSPPEEILNTDHGEVVKLTVIVKSAPQYQDRRVHVRENWLRKYSVRDAWLKSSSNRRSSVPPGVPVSLSNGAVTMYVSSYFLVGRSTDQRVRQSVAEEQKQYGDVYEAALIDHYEKMTAKTQWTLMWSLKQDYTYLALVDDDAVVVFSNFLPWLAKQPREKFYAGHQHLWLGVKRCDTPGQIRKNCVPPDVYPVVPNHDDYPPFASGFGYVISKDAAAASAQAALGHLSTPGLPGNVEDAMLGVLLNEADIHLTDSKDFYHWQHDGGRCPRQRESSLLVLGNAPDYVLQVIARNEKNHKPLCTSL